MKRTDDPPVEKHCFALNEREMLLGWFQDKAYKRWQKTASNTHTHPSWVMVALYLIGLFNRWWLAVASLLNRLVRKAQTRVCPPSELQHKCFNLKNLNLSLEFVFWFKEKWHIFQDIVVVAQLFTRKCQWPYFWHNIPGLNICRRNTDIHQDWESVNNWNK